MSFWTDLTFVRPTPPPRVTVSEFLAFVDQIALSGLVDSPSLHSLRIKTGPAINLDHNPTIDEIQAGNGISQLHEITWDVNLSDPAAITLARQTLDTESRYVYRAHAGFRFGATRPSVVESLYTDVPDQLGYKNLLFGDASVSAGILTAFGLGGEQEVPVGWIGVGIGGRGYLYPWKPRDLLERVATISELRAVEQICRVTFPVNHPATGLLSAWQKHGQRKRIRQILGAYDPFPRGPLDWAWAIRESG